MKIIPALAAVALVLAGCGKDSTGGSPTGPGGPQPGDGSGGDSLPMAASPPDLSALPGGRDHMTPLADHPPLPDACKVLTPAMVLALIPGAGKDGTVSTPRSTPGPDGTPLRCQYLATPKGSNAGAGNIIVSFQLAGHPDPTGSMVATFKEDVEAGKGKPLFKDYGRTLGAHSLAFYDPNDYEISVLYNGQPFDVSSEGRTIASNQDKWRDNVDLAIVRNIVARMNS